MSGKKPETDPTERAIQEALASVERIERESKGEDLSDLDLDEIQVLKPSDKPPSASERDPDEVEAEALATDDDDGEEILLDTGEHPAADPKQAKPSASDLMLQSMITAKNELQQVLEQTQKEAASMRERLLRVSADFENYKKRQAREREQAIKFGNEGVLKELLPVLDNMMRAVESATAQKEALSEAGETVVEGIEMVLKQFAGTLKKFGVEGFSGLGEPFDPNRHEAMSQREDASVPAGTVIEEYQRGYLLHDRLVRPSMVIVSTGGPKAASKAQEAPGDGEDADA